LFTKPIFTTTLTGETADRLFQNVTATNGHDKSFLATMRVLLHKRIRENPVVLTCRAMCFSEFEINSMPIAEALKWFIPDTVKSPTNEKHNIIIVYTTTTNVGAKMLEIIKANTGSGKRYMSSFTRHDDLKVFYARKLNALFYHSEIYRKTVIFTDKLEPNNSTLYRLCSRNIFLSYSNIVSNNFFAKTIDKPVKICYTESCLTLPMRSSDTEDTENRIFTEIVIVTKRFIRKQSCG